MHIFQDHGGKSFLHNCSLQEISPEGGDDEILDIGLREKVFDDLPESYSAVSAELGRAKEVELRFGLSKLYGLDLKPYSTPDGQIEFDLVGEKSGHHIFEIKWRSRPVDFTVVDKFITKIEQSEFPLKGSTLYIISKRGFTE